MPTPASCCCPRITTCARRRRCGAPCCAQLARVDKDAQRADPAGPASLTSSTRISDTSCRADSIRSAASKVARFIEKPGLLTAAARSSRPVGFGTRSSCVAARTALLDLFLPRYAPLVMEMQVIVSRSLDRGARRGRLAGDRRHVPAVARRWISRAICSRVRSAAACAARAALWLERSGYAASRRSDLASSCDPCEYDAAALALAATSISRLSTLTWSTGSAEPAAARRPSEECPSLVTAVWPGKPYPQGATWDGEGVNFALFSEHAEGVELCLFDNRGPPRAAAHPAARADRSGLALLSARSASGTVVRLSRATALTSRNTVIASIRTSCCSIPTRSRSSGRSRGATRTSAIASAVSAPICRRIGATTPMACRSARSSILRSPGATTVIRERPGTTRSSTRCTCAASRKQHPEVPPQYRGTYAGLATAPVIDYLQRLGITAVELMPVHFFINDRHLVEKGLRNYWGYNSIGYFAPHQDYAALDAVRARVQDDGEDAALGRHRSDSRRRLQPHRGRQSPRPDAVFPRHRQRLLLPPGARRSALLHGLHRLRQHAEHAAIRACCS